MKIVDWSGFWDNFLSKLSNKQKKWVFVFLIALIPACFIFGINWKTKKDHEQQILNTVLLTAQKVDSLIPMKKKVDEMPGKLKTEIINNNQQLKEEIRRDFNNVMNSKLILLVDNISTKNKELLKRALINTVPEPPIFIPIKESTKIYFKEKDTNVITTNTPVHSFGFGGMKYIEDDLIMSDSTTNSYHKKNSMLNFFKSIFK